MGRFFVSFDVVLFPECDSWLDSTPQTAHQHSFDSPFVQIAKFRQNVTGHLWVGVISNKILVYFHDVYQREMLNTALTPHNLQQGFHW